MCIRDRYQRRVRGCTRKNHRKKKLKPHSTHSIMASMYVRVKRQKQTVFLHTDPAETIADIKGKLAQILSVPAARQRILFQDKPVDDSKTLGDLKVENDNILHLVYKKEDSDEWEAVDVQQVPLTGHNILTLGQEEKKSE
eukprot:TRINITY_DN1981_c0_g1_i1.p1 TRINITY_DN1981_c0_g1~~TRINITY_DN1981_c0_g1_i1.p1  ORF type:complete len:140 (-),score=22.29 TRINITY_DN1981_c0_g1_i1:118-537(-)